MHQTFDIAKASRKVLSQFLENYTLEQLNKMALGFNNNLIWNIAHIVVTQQKLVYKFSGVPMIISDELFDKYKGGTKPVQDVTQAEVREIRSLLFETIHQTEVDFNNEIFKNYQEYTTSIGLTIKSIEDALSFNNYHEALHTGVIMSIRKFI
ncbi:DinB family protein [Flavobacterium rhamnosiphilum]|uniref:DinB family protein n=1 Tax=Flavobacterium rhamnosiphilum TaxID=2541724 RepID=A0A4R5FC17_9FLAO|nr:DinB family protein [Flavobacterium rhamnosiphilum]TDE46789.1 DinB family protein [Flavobacterium rhamnosiphilum]